MNTGPVSSNKFLQVVYCTGRTGQAQEQTTLDSAKEIYFCNHKNTVIQCAKLKQKWKYFNNLYHQLNTKTTISKQQKHCTKQVYCF